jgi:hypothetical protein
MHDEWKLIIAHPEYAASRGTIHIRSKMPRVSLPASTNTSTGLRSSLPGQQERGSSAVSALQSNPVALEQARIQ